MKRDKLIKVFKEMIPYIIIIILVILLRSFIITPALVDGASMKPTLEDNDVIILNKLDNKLNKINRFDIVVVNLNNEKLVKRIIGLPGEHIEYKDNNLYVNGFLVEEHFNIENDTNDFRLEDIGFLNIPGDKYFVVGDNRNNSTDSRVLGLIDEKDILGSVNIRIFPINKIGKID